ncbi:MAG: peptidase domain-containing ABC transporter, partial [Myxococcales bacterium]|nr:peptidase domain-containing ABC transporter [Myxococcales bacterium]
MSEGDCGAACLASILSYHGHNISTSDCAELLGTGRDGASAEVIYQTAEALGLKTEAFRLAIDGLAGLRLPAIVHVDGDHFVVLESIGDRGYRVFDPGGGRHWLTREDFGSRFAGVALTFTPTPKLEKRRLGRASGLVAYFRSLLSTHGARGLIAKVLVASFFLQFLGLAFPMATMLVIDEIIPGELSSLLHWVAGGMIVLTVADALLGYLRTRVLIQLQVRLDTELMTSFVRHLLSLPYNFFQSRTSGDLLMRLESNSVIREALTNQTLSLLLDGALGITYVILLFTHVPSLAWTVLAIVFFQGFLLVATTRRVHELSEREIASDAESESYLIEVLSGIATVKGSGAEPNVFSRWSRLFHRQLGASVACERLNAGLGAVTQTLDTLTPFLLLWMGAHHVLGGALSAGAMLAVNAIAMAAIDPLVGILDQAQNLQRVGAHLDRLQDALNATPEQSREASRSSRPLRGQISLCNIGFRYQPRSPWVLKDLSLSVKPGEKVAIVGRSGAGKSTLVQLLIGLQEPTEGSVRYDGVELNALDRSQLRRQIGLVLQDPFVFSGSLRSNIALHDPDLANARVVEAIRLAGLE